VLATGFVRDVPLLSFLRVLSGIGGACVFICGGALSGNVFPGRPERATTTIAMFFAGAGIGLMLCGVAIPLLLQQVGDAAWPLAWRAMGVAGLAMSVAAIWAARGCWTGRHCGAWDQEGRNHSGWQRVSGPLSLACGTVGKGAKITIPAPRLTTAVPRRRMAVA
jgi:MFS family permease